MAMRGASPQERRGHCLGNLDFQNVGGAAMNEREESGAKRLVASGRRESRVVGEAACSSIRSLGWATQHRGRAELLDSCE